MNLTRPIAERPSDLEIAEAALQNAPVHSWLPTRYPFLRFLAICEQSAFLGMNARTMVCFERRITPSDEHWQWHLDQYVERIAYGVQYAGSRWVQIWALLAGDDRALPPLVPAQPQPAVT